MVNGASLLGVTFEYQGVTYYPRVDGTVRFNIAERIANVSSRIIINTRNSNLATGNYTIKIDTFGSSDGIYYGLTSSSQVTIPLRIVNDIYGLSVDLPINDVIIDKDSGLTEDNNHNLDFNINYSSGLSSPNIRLSLYRRTYNSVYSYNYEIIDLSSFIEEELATTSNNYEYMVTSLPNATNRLVLNTKDSLTTGTYRFLFKLYDGNTFIGSAYHDVIVE